jgi:hypothetical protein
VIFTWALDGLISFIFSKQTLVIKLCPTLSPLFVHVLVVSCPTLSPLFVHVLVVSCPTLSPLFVHVLVVSCCSLYSITRLHVLVRVVVYATILHENDILFVLIPTCFVGSSCFINVIYVYLRILVSNTLSKSDDVRVV